MNLIKLQSLKRLDNGKLCNYFKINKANISVIAKKFIYNSILRLFNIKAYYYRYLIDFKTLNKYIKDTRNPINEKLNFVEMF